MSVLLLQNGGHKSTRQIAEKLLSYRTDIGLPSNPAVELKELLSQTISDPVKLERAIALLVSLNTIGRSDPSTVSEQIHSNVPEAEVELGVTKKRKRGGDFDSLERNNLQKLNTGLEKVERIKDI
jgi:hypothetical protein